MSAFYPLSSTDQQLLLAASLITTYVGGFMFILGTIGNTMNIMAFCCLKVYRPLSTSAFLAAASLSGQVYLTCSLFLASLSNILGYNPASRDTTLCKAMLFIPRVALQIMLTCLCFSAVDRYLMTSRSARFRALITPVRARLAICFCVVVWTGYCVPSLLYVIAYSFANLCIPSQGYATTVTYLNLFFSVLIPITILSLFGFLTWRNLGRTRLSSLNVQVTKMILADILVVTISNLPLACFLIYGVTKSANRLFTPIEILIVYLTQLTTAVQSAGSFYFYLLISPAYRTNIKAMVVKVFCWWNPTLRNTVVPHPGINSIQVRTTANVVV